MALRACTEHAQNIPALTVSYPCIATGRTPNIQLIFFVCLPFVVEAFTVSDLRVALRHLTQPCHVYIGAKDELVNTEVRPRLFFCFCCSMTLMLNLAP